MDPGKSEQGTPQPPPAETSQRPDHELPAGVSISDIRYRMPKSGTLIVRFERPTPPGLSGPDSLDLIAKKPGTEAAQEYQLYMNVPYVVNLNPDAYGDIFLNPLQGQAPPGVPEESNIPFEINQWLALGPSRLAAGNLSIIVHSPDCDLTQLVSAAEDQARYEQSYSRFSALLKESDDPQLRALVSEAIAGSDLGRTESAGTHMAEYTYELAVSMARGRFMASQETGSPQPNLPDLISQSARQLGAFLDGLYDRRLPALQQLAQEHGPGLYFALDNAPVYPDAPGEGDYVLTTYVPKRGWSISLPLHSCSNAATGVFDLALSGASLEDFPVFRASLGQAQAAGNLIIDQGHKTIGYRSMGWLRHTQFVYHGDEAVDIAARVVAATGDVILGTGAVFNNTLFQNASEFDQNLTPGPPIKIARRDLGPKD